jgi:hypothetical protein
MVAAYGHYWEGRHKEPVSNLSKDRGMFDHDISILVTTAYDNFSVFVLAEGKILVEDIV